MSSEEKPLEYHIAFINHSENEDLALKFLM